MGSGVAAKAQVTDATEVITAIVEVRVSGQGVLESANAVDVVAATAEVDRHDCVAWRSLNVSEANTATVNVGRID